MFWRHVKNHRQNAPSIASGAPFCPDSYSTAMLYKSKSFSYLLKKYICITNDATYLVQRIENVYIGAEGHLVEKSHTKLRYETESGLSLFRNSFLRLFTKDIGV